jgi:ESS family glutamate:Na+ symporter
VLFGIIVVYRVMGRDYEAAVATAGFLGFSMGATATAIASCGGGRTQWPGPAPAGELVSLLI